MGHRKYLCLVCTAVFRRTFSLWLALSLKSHLNKHQPLLRHSNHDAEKAGSNEAEAASERYEPMFACPKKTAGRTRWRTDNGTVHKMFVGLAQQSWWQGYLPLNSWRGHFDFGEIFRKISILVKFSKKIWFWWNYLKKFSIFFIRFYSKFRKKIDFGQNFQKFDFSQIFEKISNWVKFSKNFDFFEKFEKFRFKSISIFSKMFKTSDFGQIFEKISSLVKISNKFDFFENFEKFRILSIFKKISILVRIFLKFQFWSKFRKISIFRKVGKIRF